MTSGSGGADEDAVSPRYPKVAARAVRGSFLSVGASTVTLTLGFGRSVLLARLLLPEHFGVVALALFYTQLIDRLRALGLGRAMVHRHEIDERVTATYFTLQLVLLLASLFVLIPLAFVLNDPKLGSVLLTLGGVGLVKGLNTYQEAFLNRDLDFRRLATADVVSAVAMTVLAPFAAWQGWGVWSLVVEQASGQLARAGVLWLHADRARPRLGWDGDIARWFWRFGTRVWMSSNLTYLIDRFDDFWVGTMLGKTPLGYYSRAYEFARYPRRVIANPLVSVFFPTFARLQNNRLLLSQTFFRVASLMIRVGFWFGMVFILTAPELVQLFLGERWLPMLTTFQLMIVYTLVDPLTIVAGNLLLATGHPGDITRVRAIQLAVFVPAVIGLGHWQGIEGVALAADLMVLLGVILLFAQTRRVVDYSLRTLWFWPSAALMSTTIAVLMLPGVWEHFSLWGGLFGKGIFITVLYGGLLWLAEREQLTASWQAIRRAIKPIDASLSS